ncbi:MAG: glycoside hydrolase family 97 catalytic domain-containing protein [Bacteroidota bacterium]
METNWVLLDDSHDLSFRLSLHERGELYYVVIANDEVLIDSSRLGAIRSDADLSTGLSFVATSAREVIDRRHHFVTGKAVAFREQGVEQSFLFQNALGAEIQIVCRLYADGLALRYEFPGSSDQAVTLEQDIMEYRFAPRTKAWLQPYDRITKWTPAYERFVEHDIDVGQTSSYGNGWAFPALFKTVGDRWILLSESATHDFAGTHLDNEEGSSIYSLRWPESDEAMGLGQSVASALLPWRTSWKTIAIGDLSTIVSSNMVRQLGVGSTIGEATWVRPGRVSWSWLSDHDSPQDKEKLKRFIDLAAEMGWEYSLVDANWNLMPQGTIEELVAYATARDVGLLLWYNSGGPHNEVTEQPRDRLNDRDRRREEFAWMRDIGVKGMKVDFFQSDKPDILKLYTDILADAADYELMVNFHGCAIPRGWSSAYPNLMTMESVRGAESYTFDESYPANAPKLNTILPFTRNVIGSMDYTPTVMTDMQFPHITTNAHEMALAWLFESGWQHLADAVEGFQKLPPPAIELLKDLPVTWDEVKYVRGYPGQDVVLARRKGDVWYVAGINGEDQPKAWDLDLSFISGPRSITGLEDGAGPREIGTNQDSWVGEELPVQLLPYGGFVFRFEPRR